MDGLFTLRDMVESDLDAVNALSYSEGFGVVGSEDCVRVAVNEFDQMVGFIRFVSSEEGVRHVNPVIVYEGWRRYGVGRALINDALMRFGEIRLVSRGGSIPFYEALGFESCDWDCIHPPVAAECDGCELREECNPNPMQFVYIKETDED